MNGVRRLSLLPFALAIAALAVSSARASEPLDLFHNESAARNHCGHDSVVWVDVPTNRYWRKGQPGYGGSKTGGYTCLKDAVRAHNRPAIAKGAK